MAAAPHAGPASTPSASTVPASTMPGGEGAVRPGSAAAGAILVVDDSHVARQAVETRLVRQGLTVVAAAARAEAETIDPAGLSAALLDLELVDGTGVDIAGRLRASRSALPIAFLTSAPASALAERARAFGPVFEKGSGTDDAIAWAARCVSG